MRYRAALDRWELELHLFNRLKQLKLFRLYKMWKAFRVWKRAVNQHKFAAARASLEKHLFKLSPVFQASHHRQRVPIRGRITYKRCKCH